MTKPKPWKTGATWKDGKYYHFGPDTITVAQGWPGLRVWTKKKDQPWRGSRFGPASVMLCDPYHLEHQIYLLEVEARMRPELSPFPLSVSQFAQLMHAKAELALINTIPPSALKRVLSFCQRRWHLLCLQARVPGADDLLDSNPVLGWMLANHWIFREGKGKSDASRVARRWVGKRQRDILEWLGFESSDSTRRIIARLPPWHITAENLLYLRIALHNAEVQKTMQHLSGFSADSLRILTDPLLRERVTHHFLTEVAKKAGSQSMAVITNYSWQLRHLLMAAKAWGFDLPRQIRSLQELQALTYEHQDVLYLTPSTYPAAPWTGTPGIEPIIDTYALQREGMEMHHCALNHDDEIANGRLYFYRVLQPVRATLSVRREGKDWKLHEISGVCNRPIDCTSVQEIWTDLTGSKLTNDKCPLGTGVK